LAFLSVERVLKSPAFELVSLFSKEAQDKIDRYYTLRKKTVRSPEENQQLELIAPAIQKALGPDAAKTPTPLETKVDAYLNKTLK